jgi:hypothetical protein
MSRTEKEKPRCPEGHSCEICYRPYGTESDNRDYTKRRKMRTEKRDLEAAYPSWYESDDPDEGGCCI